MGTSPAVVGCESRLKIAAAESRLYSRLSDIEDKVEASRQDLADELGEVRGAIREPKADDE